MSLGGRSTVQKAWTRQECMPMPAMHCILCILETCNCRPARRRCTGGKNKVPQWRSERQLPFDVSFQEAVSCHCCMFHSLLKMPGPWEIAKVQLGNLGPPLISNISKNIKNISIDGRDGSLIRQNSSVRSVRGPSHLLLDVRGFPPCFRLQETKLSIESTSFCKWGRVS